jgi:hypothetical protein
MTAVGHHLARLVARRGHAPQREPDVPGARAQEADVAGRRGDHPLLERGALDALARGELRDLVLQVGSYVLERSMLSEMLALSLSSDTCIATMPPSRMPITQMHARPRSIRSTTR